MIVRPFQSVFADELEAVHSLIDASTRADWVHRVGHHVLRNVLDPVHSTTVAWLDGRPAGFAWWERKHDALTFEGWVDPAQRRRGVGTALLVQIERFAREHGTHSLRGTTYSDNPGAQAGLDLNYLPGGPALPQPERERE